MLRHVSEHDLPLSVQELQKLNNRRMAFHSPGPRQSRELKVNVFPKRKTGNQNSNNTTKYSPVNNSAEAILNQTPTSGFVREIQRDSIETIEPQNTEINNSEDEVNNNINKESECLIPDNRESNQVNKSTQTNFVIKTDSAAVAYNHNHIVCKYILGKSSRVKIKKQGTKNKQRNIHSTENCKKLRKRSSSKLSIKNSISTNVKKSKAASAVEIKKVKSKKIQKNQNDTMPKCVDTEGVLHIKEPWSCKKFYKEEYLMFVSYMPLYFVSLLAVLCTVSYIFHLFIIPNINSIYVKIINLIFYSKERDSNVGGMIPSLLKKPIIFIYEYMPGIG